MVGEVLYMIACKGERDYWDQVWDDNGDGAIMFTNRNSAFNKAVDEAKKNPGRLYYIFEAVQGVRVPVGEPETVKINRGMEEFGV